MRAPPAATLALAALLAGAAVAAQEPGSGGPAIGIEGRVIDARTRTPIPEALVTLHPTIPADSARAGRGGAGAGGEGADAPVARAVAGDDGRFTFRGIEPGSYRLRVEALGYAADAGRSLEYEGGLLRVDVAVLPSPIETEGIDVVVTRPSVREERSQVISGVVLDARADRPLPELDLVLRYVDGEVMGRTTTDDEGHFLFAVGRPGLYRLHLTRIGYDSASVAQVAVAPGQDVYVELRAEPTAIGLGEIRVSAPRTLPWLEASGFYHRRELGRGEFFGPDEVARRPAVFPTQLLRRLPDITVVRGDMWFRGTIGPGGLPCRPTIILDGLELREMHIDRAIPKSFIEAVEVYKHIGEVPQKWRGHMTCGVIAIWTDR